MVVDELSIGRSAGAGANPHASLRLVRLTELMEISAGVPDIAVAVIDGPIAWNHPGLVRSNIRVLNESAGTSCDPRNPADIELLVEALLPRPRAIDLVIGIKGPIAPPTLCNGLMIPIVAFDQIYPFDMDSLIGAMPKPEDKDSTRFAAAAEEIFNRVAQIGDNSGSLDEHRALNYLLVRYPRMYAVVMEAYAKGASLTAVTVRPSRLGTSRNIVEVIFSFTPQN